MEVKTDEKTCSDIKEEEEEDEILKKRISSHPLFALLLHSHLNCLKVCSGDFDSLEINNTKNHLHLHTQSSTSSSDLDQFMGVYCSTLRELKESMEKPLLETQRFVDSVYTQLNDIVRSSSP